VRPPLQILDVCAGQARITTGGAATWVTVPQLDSARLTIRRFGVAYVNSNGIDEADVTEIHNAIRRAAS
jgi:hypothetical protein